MIAQCLGAAAQDCFAAHCVGQEHFNGLLDEIQAFYDEHQLDV
jgi:hypothetical protein